MSSNGNQVPLAPPSQRGPGSYPRASTPHRPVECYHPSGAAGAAYMPNTAGGAQASAQATLRVQPTPQPSAPPAPQQDMSKTSMAGHSYVSQNQTPQPRPPFTNYPYRGAQHGTRPNTHPRQQQSFLPTGAATPTGPVMFPTLVFQPTPMGMQSYQQPRSSTPAGYFPYMGHYIGYNTPPSHTSPYFYTSNSPQLPTPNLPTNPPGGRSNPTTLVGPQGTPATPTAPTATLSHPQASTLMHQTMSGIRPSPQKRSHRVPIIDPKTQQDIFSELYTSDNNFLGSEANDRQTPQPEQPTHSIAEQFNRMVNEVANQDSCDNSIKSNYASKNVDVPATSTPSSVQTQPNTISSINNNVVKSEILTVNENKNLGPDIAVESSETPIVSAISDSPVIVPKMPMNIKQLQKNSEQTVQSLVLDTNKNIPPNKQFKQSKNVPQVDEVEKPSDNVNVTPVIIATISPITTSTTVVTSSVPAPTQTTASVVIPTPIPIVTPAPQPQRIREPRERVKSEDKEKSKDIEAKERDTRTTSNKPNGPTPTAVISSVDNLPEAISPSTSQNNQVTGVELAKKHTSKQSSPAPDTKPLAAIETNVETVVKSEPVVETPPTATQLLSASIEKVAKEQHSVHHKAPEVKEASSAIEAQAKLTQSISSVLRTIQPESKMKDINLNNKTTDPDTANGNSTDVTKTETVKVDINKNEKVLKNSKNTNKKTANKMPINDLNMEKSESYENGKDETDSLVNVKDKPAEEVAVASKAVLEEEKTAKETPPVFVPKYKYGEDQWSPLNTAGKKCYDIDLLKQIKDDPLSKNKPNVPLLEAWNVIRTTPMQEPQPFTISRPINDSLFPQFAKTPGMGSRNNTPREAKKDSRNMAQSGKGSVKLTPTSSGSSSHKPVIHVSLSLREEVKLNEVDSAWKPTRFRHDNMNEDEEKTQELYKKFRGILNKLTPQKFDTLLDRVNTLEINNQKRLEGVIDLVFEKAIDEPNFSEAYANMCSKLSVLKVPADNPNSDKSVGVVNFRALIINKCQNQFESHKTDEQVLKLEKELSESTDSTKKKELSLLLEEENRRVRMRSVGNVRFIGELYKLKMLTSKIMDYCMKHLIDKLEEEKLECLCKLLTTIGEQVENEGNGQLDNIFKKMQEIVDRKSNKISSRVRFMLQDVIELRKRKWVAKTVIDSQPKMMDQIQKEAEQHQRHIELMNASPVGNFRGRDEGGRGKRGDGRRQNSNNAFMDTAWKSTRANYTVVDTSKLKAVTQRSTINNIKLAPHNSAWNHGSGTKSTAQASSNSMISLSKNMYSGLEVQADTPTLRGNRDMTPNYHSKGASIERSTFNSRGDFTSGGGSRSGSVGVARSNSGTRSTSATPSTPPVANEAPAPAPAPAPVPREPLPEANKKSVKSMIDLSLINPNDDEVVAEVKQLFLPQYHADVVREILEVAMEKTAKQFGMIAKTLLHLVSTNTISVDNFVAGLKDIFEYAPDLFIDIPMLYESLGKLIAPQIEKKHITFIDIFRLCENIISSNHGNLLLKSIVKELKESMGPSFVKSKWLESGFQLSQWMDEKQVEKWLEDNKFEFLEGDSKTCEEAKKILSPAQTLSKLIQLMNADENCDCIKGWVQDKFGKSANEDWFMRALIQAICEHALFGPEGRDVPHFNQDRMNKYANLINDFGDSKQPREASCLFGIQQLIHRLEHPQGLTLEIFQYLHEQYIISLDGFLEWEKSEKEPEGKGVMMKALTSFFTNIKEADNEDSCSED